MIHHNQNKHSTLVWTHPQFHITNIKIKNKTKPKKYQINSHNLISLAKAKHHCNRRKKCKEISAPCEIPTWYRGGLWLWSSNSCSYRTLFVVAFKLAQVSFLSDELSVVVPAVETPFVCNIVRWAYSTPAMATFEAALVICSSIYRDLSNNNDSCKSTLLLKYFVKMMCICFDICRECRT